MGKDLNGKELGDYIGQRKNGKYFARFTNRFGKRVTFYDTDLAAVRKKLKLEMGKDTVRKNVQNVYTLDEWFKLWMEEYKFQLRENSKRHYRTVYQKHISPVLGKKRIADITTLDIQKLVNDLVKVGYQYETQSKVKLLLVDMFNRAMGDEFVLRNPARSVRIKKKEAQERRVLTPEEETDFFATCKGTFYDELFTVALLTGLRPGEVCALRWRDIDLEHRTISVTRTLLYQKLDGDTKKTFHIDPPKTPSSNRIVHFDERCEIALKGQFRKKSIISAKRNAKTIPGFEDLLFVTMFDTPINAQTFSEAIREIIRIINMSRSDVEQFQVFSAHCFRHTYATRCFEAGVDIKVVQKQLGHASIKMTMDLYTHLLDDQKARELNKFTELSEQVLEGSEDLAETRFQEALNPKILAFDKMA